MHSQVPSLLELLYTYNMKESRPQFCVYKTSQEAWSAMFERIKKAEKSIYWEQYIFVDDAEGRVFVDILKKRAERE